MHGVRCSCGLTWRTEKAASQCAADGHPLAAKTPVEA